MANRTFPNLECHEFLRDVVRRNECIMAFDYTRVCWRDITTLDFTRTVFSLLYVCVISTAALSNTLIIFLILRHDSLRTVRNLFIATLAIADLCLALSSGIFTPLAIFNGGDWMFGPLIACRTLNFLQGLCMFISPYTLAAISIDRFILIVRARRTAPINTRRATLIIGGIWVLAAAMCIGPVSTLQLKPVMPGFCDVSCQEDWTNRTRPYRKLYGYVSTCVQYILPLTVISVCYTLAGRTIAQQCEFRRQTTSQHHRPVVAEQNVDGLTTAISERPENDLSEKSKRRTSRWNQRRSIVNFGTSNSRELKRMANTNRVLMAVVFAFVLCWTPTVLYNLALDLGLQVGSRIMNFNTLIAHLVAMCSTVTNPILYGMCNRNLRDAFLTSFPWMKRKPESRQNVQNQKQRNSLIEQNNGEEMNRQPTRLTKSLVG